MSRTRPVLLLMVFAVMLAVATISPVYATYPGQVGRLAFAMTGPGGNVDIYSALANGSGLRRLTTNAGFDACAAYSADGKKIAFCSNRTGKFEIWAMNSDGSGQRAVTHLGGNAVFPDWSPNGNRIAFSGTEGTDPNDEIYVVDATTGGHLVALTSCAGLAAGCSNDYPAWSPDGRRIVFIHATDADKDGNPVDEQVWVMNADGSHKVQLTSGAAPHDQVPDWSPDGKRIAYEEGAVGSGRIWVMNADGSHKTKLTFGAGDDFGAAWSPDGRQIAFVRDFGNGDRPVFVMNADGSGQHQLTPGKPKQFVPGWQPAS